MTISLAGPEGRNSLEPFSIRVPDPNLAVPDRPVWILESGFPQLEGADESAGATTANQKTFAFGELPPGETLAAVWDVTPVRAGDWRLTYQVDAGLFGKARAETSDGQRADRQLRGADLRRAAPDASRWAGQRRADPGGWAGESGSGSGGTPAPND